jgi:hypothetical protein
MRPLKVLVACEFTGTVRRAFAARGHDVWSCDLLPSLDRSNRHITGDVRDVLDDDWDFLMVAHPPCFEGDTLVLTSDGYKTIASVKVGDMVLTHIGRWRKVTETMKKLTPTVVRVKSSNNLETVTTPEHPYYTRYREPYRNLFRTKKERDLKPEFVNAGELTNRHFTCSVLPPTRRADVSLDDLWLMGRYVADGHMRNSRWTEGKYEEMIISVGRHEINEFLAKVKRKVTVYDAETALKATFYGHDSIEMFAQFGRSADTKALPEWVLALPKKQAAAFLDGYISGDGHIHERRITTSSVSKSLTLGIALLMQRVYGKCPALRTHPPRGQSIIEGREVNNREQYGAEVPHSCERLRNYIDGIYAWGHVRSVETEQESTVVYNLSVEEDETYTANGVVVHNCTRLCNSGVRWLKEPPGKLTAEHYSAREIAAYKLMNRRERLDFMWMKLDQGAKLFSTLWNAKIPLKALENPVMHQYAKERIRNYRDPAQSIQPWMFGDPETKRTCFWLEGLPPLKLVYKKWDECRIALKLPKDAKPEARVHLAAPGAERWKERSKFFPSVAKSMARQWTPDLLQ